MNNAVEVKFTVKMETERAYIVQNVQLLGKSFITECNFPKMATDIKSTTKAGITTAMVEEWVLRQRKEEEIATPTDSKELASALLADFEDAPF